jgi:hypothetical protein
MVSFAELRARVRPPLVELTPEEANLLAADLKKIGFGM